MIKRIMLTADEGKTVTNGKIYGKTLYLAERVDTTAFYEIDETEHAAILEGEKRKIIAETKNYI